MYLKATFVCVYILNLAFLNNSMQIWHYIHFSVLLMYLTFNVIKENKDGDYYIVILAFFKLIANFAKC